MTTKNVDSCKLCDGIIVTNFPTYANWRNDQKNGDPNKGFNDLSLESKEMLEIIFDGREDISATDIRFGRIDANNGLILCDFINFLMDGKRYSEFTIAGVVFPIECTGRFDITLGPCNELKNYIIMADHGKILNIYQNSEITHLLPDFSDSKCTLLDLLSPLAMYIWSNSKSESTKKVSFVEITMRLGGVAATLYPFFR